MKACFSVRNETQVGNLLAGYQGGFLQTNEITKGGKSKACDKNSRIGQIQINAILWGQILISNWKAIVRERELTAVTDVNV